MTTTIDRTTSETTVRVSLSGESSAIAITTSIPFLDHMLTVLARYSAVGMRLEARGDLRHHIIEDVAICIGKAFAALAPEARARFGERTIPMDDALVQCVLDLGGRPYYRGPLPSPMYDHWMRSFADNAGATLHLRVLRGRDRHHIIEAAFKSLGLALAQAIAPSGAVFSTKGNPVIQENA
jgi:imidazoleglycerol-phosphate dehydratase